MYSVTISGLSPIEFSRREDRDTFFEHCVEEDLRKARARWGGAVKIKRGEGVYEIRRTRDRGSPLWASYIAH